MSRHRRSGAEPTFLGAMAALLVGVAVLAIAAELVLRVAMPGWREFYSGWFMTSISVPGRADVTVGIAGFDGYFAQNNGDFRAHIRVNAFNLRDDEPVEAANGRLWVIGDSMSFGWGVEADEMYSSRIAKTLGIGTYNVAGPGSNVCGWQTLYARMPESVRPSVVVVGLTVENRVGIFDCKAEIAAANAKTPPEQVSEGFSPVVVKQWLTRRSALYNFFAVSLKRINLGEMILTRLGVIEDPNKTSMHGHTVERAPDMIRTTADELANLRAMVPREIPFVVAVFPARPEIKDGNEYYHGLRTGMEQALAERGIATIDMLDDFSRVGFEPTHFAHDGHWSALGHKVAGEAISRWLVGHGYVTPQVQ